MYQRFKDSIITPRNIVNFRNDKLVYVLAYVLFFALLLSTRMIIEVVTFDGISYSTQMNIKEQMPSLNPNCGFTDTTYICEDEQIVELYNDGVISYNLDSEQVFSPSNYSNTYNFVIHYDKVYIIYSGNIIKTEEIKNVLSPLMNLDFSLQQQDPDRFYNTIFQAVDSYIVLYKSLWAPFLLAIDYLSGALLFFVFLLFSAFMMRVRFPEIPFKQLFTMNAYSATALYLILIFNSLFRLDFFLLILLLFVAFRQNGQLNLEIVRRLKRKS